MSVDQIYQDGQHYDLLFKQDNAQLAFWYDCAALYGDPILELAVGTGRIAIPLAQAGHQVTGIDLSAAMLAEARRKAAEQQISLTLQQGDMRAFDLGQRFGLVILANNALCHLLTIHDFERTMRMVQQHLQPAGRFIVENFVPNLELLLHQPDQRYPFSDYADPSGAGRIVVTQTSWYDVATQIRHNRTYYQYPNQTEEVGGSLDMRMYFPQELDALFRYNGFVIEHKYSGLDRRPFDGQSTMQVFVLRQA
jgi:SAM-dependent methyltransferase